MNRQNPIHNSISFKIRIKKKRLSLFKDKRFTLIHFKVLFY
jgi:hypothetical protein